MPRHSTAPGKDSTPQGVGIDDLFSGVLLDGEKWRWGLYLRYLTTERDGWPKPITRRRVFRVVDECSAETEAEAIKIFESRHGANGPHNQWLAMERGPKRKPENAEVTHARNER